MVMDLDAGTGGGGWIGADENSSPLVGDRGCLGAWDLEAGFTFRLKKKPWRGEFLDATLLLVSEPSLSWDRDPYPESFDSSEVPLTAPNPSCCVAGETGDVSEVFSFDNCNN